MLPIYGVRRLVHFERMLFVRERMLLYLYLYFNATYAVGKTETVATFRCNFCTAIFHLCCICVFIYYLCCICVFIYVAYAFFIYVAYFIYVAKQGGETITTRLNSQEMLHECLTVWSKSWSNIHATTVAIFVHSNMSKCVWPASQQGYQLSFVLVNAAHEAPGVSKF